MFNHMFYLGPSLPSPSCGAWHILGVAHVFEMALQAAELAGHIDQRAEFGVVSIRPAAAAAIIHPLVAKGPFAWEQKSSWRKSVPVKSPGFYCTKYIWLVIGSLLSPDKKMENNVWKQQSGQWSHLFRWRQHFWMAQKVSKLCPSYVRRSVSKIRQKTIQNGSQCHSQDELHWITVSFNDRQGWTDWTLCCWFHIFINKVVLNVLAFALTNSWEQPLKTGKIRSLTARKKNMSQKWWFTLAYNDDAVYIYIYIFVYILSC